MSRNARLVVEKPFGRDRASAQALNKTLHEHFPEERDLPHRPLSRQGAGPEHRLHALRQRDLRAAVEPPLRPQHPDHDGGILRRGRPRRFYDATGALRDVVQNHMLQVVANLMMDPPTGEECEASRDQKAALLKAVRPLDKTSLVRGQYRGYRSVRGVKPGSSVETYAALRLFVDSWRWAGVPVYIRAGKRLAADGRGGRRRVPSSAARGVRRPWRAQPCPHAAWPGRLRGDGVAGQASGRADDRRDRRTDAGGTPGRADAALSAPARRRDARRQRFVRPRGRRRRAMAHRPTSSRTTRRPVTSTSLEPGGRKQPTR